MFERKHERPAPIHVFIRRMLMAIGIAAGLVIPALLIGIIGYHWIAGFEWVDSFLEASMILGGMGPVNALHSDGAKIFAALYALFSGVVFIGVMGIILTPVVHRVLHKFHFDS